METTKRRNFVQRVLCLFGGAVGASALSTTSSASTSPVMAPLPKSNTLQLHLQCRHKHRTTQNGRAICGGKVLDRDGNTVGHFYANCFCAESSFGDTNPFAASNIELHTIRLAEGTIFGMGANNSKTEIEKAHAIIGGTGRFAGVRGSYTIADTGSPDSGSRLTINLLS